MHKLLYLMFGLLVATAIAFSAQGTTGAVEGTLKKIDADSKTIFVKSADGTEHVFHFTDQMAVHGAKETEKTSKDKIRGLQEGSDVVVHYSKRGTANTADEIDLIGKNGLKTSEGTIKTIDRDAKTMVVKGTNGTEETYRLSERAAKDSGSDIGKEAKKSEKATVYYSEEAGHKVVHFFKRAL